MPSLQQKLTKTPEEVSSKTFKERPTKVHCPSLAVSCPVQSHFWVKATFVFVAANYVCFLVTFTFILILFSFPLFAETLNQLSFCEKRGREKGREADLSERLRGEFEDEMRLQLATWSASEDVS